MPEVRITYSSRSIASSIQRLEHMVMTNTTTVTAHLNPDTPLAFLPPDLANQLELIRYFSVATLGVSYFIVINMSLR